MKEFLSTTADREAAHRYATSRCGPMEADPVTWNIAAIAYLNGIKHERNKNSSEKEKQDEK